MLLCVPAASAQVVRPLTDAHRDLEVKCANCHGDEPPVAAAPMRACLRCHDSYDVVAARTAKLNPNPHKSHLGALRCSYCHSSHGEPKLYCAECHQFKDMKAK